MSCHWGGLQWVVINCVTNAITCHAIATNCDRIVINCDTTVITCHAIAMGCDQHSSTAINSVISFNELRHTPNVRRSIYYAVRSRRYFVIHLDRTLLLEKM